MTEMHDSNFEDMLAGKQLGTWQINAISPDRIVDGQVVFATNDIVILAMPRCGMDGAGTGIDGDMLA